MHCDKISNEKALLRYKVQINDKLIEQKQQGNETFYRQAP